MDALEITLLVFGILTILFTVGYIVYIKYISNGGGGGKNSTKSGAPLEVFPIMVKGSHLLGKAELMPGYRYAKTTEIDEALAKGMRVPGVKSGDYAFFYDKESPTSYPNIYICNDGDFDTNVVIQWPFPSDKGDSSTRTFICFVYGYKPPKYAVKEGFQIYVLKNAPCHATNKYITSKSQIIAWSPNLWNDPSPKEGKKLNGKEMFMLLLVVPMNYNNGEPPSLKSMANTLKKNGDFTIPTGDQLIWSNSQGLGQGMKLCLTSGFTSTEAPFKNIDPQLGNAVTLGYCLNNMTYKGLKCDSIPSSGYCDGTYCYYGLGVWGVKKDFPSQLKYPIGGASSHITHRILPFNYKKNSIYDK